jgi:hypothetical protein
MVVPVLLGACSIGSVQDIAKTRDVSPENASYLPKPDRALIVFLRPSAMFAAYDAAIFDVTEGGLQFAASLSDKSKLAYYATPGKRRFMVVGFNADFMTTDLEAGKLYYALISPSYGLRFWFRAFKAEGPYTKNNLDFDSGKFSEWYKSSRWVENVETPRNSEKADTYLEFVRAVRAEWEPRWRQRSDTPRLDTGDGRTSPYGG